MIRMLNMLMRNNNFKKNIEKSKQSDIIANETNF